MLLCSSASLLQELLALPLSPLLPALLGAPLGQGWTFALCEFNPTFFWEELPNAAADALEGAEQAPKDSWDHPEVLQELSKQEVGLDARLGEHRRLFPNIFLGKFLVGQEGAIVGFVIWPRHP